MNNKTRYAIIVFSLLSPILSGFISANINPNMGGSVGLGAVLLVITGPLFIGGIGLLVSGLVSLFKVKNKNWSLTGYVLSAVFICYLILK